MKSFIAPALLGLVFVFLLGYSSLYVENPRLRTISAEEQDLRAAISGTSFIAILLCFGWGAYEVSKKE